MPIHTPNRVVLAYAVAVTYVMICVSLVAVMCSFFVKDGTVPPWMYPAVIGLSLSAFPLGKVTDRMLKH